MSMYRTFLTVSLRNIANIALDTWQLVHCIGIECGDDKIREGLFSNIDVIEKRFAEIRSFVNQQHARQESK